MRHLSLIRWTLCCLITLLLTGSLPARTPDDVDMGHIFSTLDRARLSAVIFCQNGQETLDVHVNMAEQPGEGWILVIPAKPGDISISWIDRLPKFEGRYSISKLHANLEWILVASRATQIYPVVFDILWPNNLGRSAVVPPATPSTLHDGLSCALIAPSSADDLERAVQQSGIALHRPQIESLLPYVNGSNTFLFLRLESVPDYKASLPNRMDVAAPCLEIQFPSTNPVLPFHVRPSMYELQCGQDVCIVGQVELADASQEDGGFPRTRLFHYRGTLIDPHDPEKVRDVAYTRWWSGREPREVRFTSLSGTAYARADACVGLLCSAPVMFIEFILWTTFCSYMSSLIAAVVVRWDCRSLFRLALWNFGTVLLLRARLAYIEGSSATLTATKRSAFLLVFTLSYFILSYLATELLTVFLGHFTP